MTPKTSFAKQSPLPTVTRYPWDRWFRKKGPFKLKRFRDFRCEVYGMFMNVKQAARRAGLKVIVKIDGNSILVEVRHGEVPRKYVKRQILQPQQQ
jgi:hypothetical protein